MKAKVTVQLAALAAACTFSFAELHAQSFNPTAPALGFNVFTSGAVTIVGGDTHGPLAVGGNLVLAGNAPLAMNTSGRYPTNALNSTGNYGLVINGQVQYQSGGNPTYVNNGLIRIGNTTGTTLYDKDNNNSNTDLQLTSGAFGSTPRVQKQNGWQDKNTATQLHGINFSTAATQIAQNSAIIASYATNNCQNKINLITPPSCNSCNPTLSLMANKVNFVNITTQAQLSALLSSGSLSVSPAPTATSPLIFNVTLSGTITWPVPNMGGIGGQDGPYILWNFPNATAINFGNNNSVYGTILAPQAAVIKNGGNNFEGQVLSAALSLNTGEIHYQPFNALLPQCSTPLSLESLTITAVRRDAGVQLSWVAVGLDGASLNLERSVDGAAWTSIAEAVRGAALVDNSAPATKLFYRLRVQGQDGNIQYSSAAVVEGVTKLSSPAIAPNPFVSSITVTGVEASSTITLLDAVGRVVVTQTAQSDVVRFDGLEILPAGMYFLRCTSASGSAAVLKLMKR